MQELLVLALPRADALAKLLIEKGIITQQKFLASCSGGATNIATVAATANLAKFMDVFTCAVFRSPGLLRPNFMA